MAIDPTLADDIASIKTTVEQIYQLLHEGVDSVAQPPRPAYFKDAVDKAEALAAHGLTLTGPLTVKPTV